MKTVKQPTLAPTRKMWAVTISGAVVSIARYYIQTHFPVLDNIEFYALIENIVSFAVIFAAGYMTEDRANVGDTPTESKEV